MAALLTFQDVQAILGDPGKWFAGSASRLHHWWYHGTKRHCILREPTLPAKTRRRRGSIYLPLDSLESILDHEIKQFELGTKRARKALANLREYKRALNRGRAS